MGLTKHASFTVLSAKIAETGAPRLRVEGHRAEFQYEPRPGFLYVRSRAISSRCNDNYDEFPAAEIKVAFRTFIGKPVFVNHHNADHRRARGVIIDAALHEDVNPDGTPDTWAEVLMEVDAIRFPKLAQAIVQGHIDRTSMGTDVQYTICSACGNKATSPVEYCQHIPKMKGKRIYRTTASGSKEGVLIREICYGLGFFENSLLVEEPADPTAYFLGVDSRGLQTTASKHAVTAAKPETVSPSETEDPSRYEGVTIKQDDKGRYFVQTHRARSDAYESPEKIPNSAIKFIRSTGSAKTAMWESPGGHILTDDVLARVDLDLLARAYAAEADDLGIIPPMDSATRLAWQAGYQRPGRTAKSAARDDLWSTKGTTEVPTTALKPGMVLRSFDGFSDTMTIVSVEDEPQYGFYRVTFDTGLVVGHAPKDRTWFVEGGTTATKTAALLPGEATTEAVAPADVDTLRAERCPVCGEEDAFDGEKCRVCGFISPPEDFGDPDTSKAKVNDLRQHEDDTSGMLDGGLRCTECGHTFEAAPQPNKVALFLDKPAEQNREQETAPETASKVGDTCPDCGQGVLEAVANPSEEETGSDDDFSPAGSAVTRAETGATQFAPAGSAVAHKTLGAARLGGSQKEKSMRPALKALAEQQVRLDQQQAAIARIASLAGLANDPVVRVAIRRTAADENPAFGGPITDGQAVGTEAPAVTSEEASTPSAKDDPTNIGASPLTDVSPGATTSVTDTATVLDTPLDLNEQDVSAQVAGTDDGGNGARGQSGTNRIDTDVRINAPSTDTAFNDGGFLSTGSGRFVASLRLARLQIQAGIARGDDLILAEAIASSKESDHDIQTKVATLQSVVGRAATPQVAPARLVPQAASRTAATRSVPSLGGAGEFALPQFQMTASVTDAEVAFEG